MEVFLSRYIRNPSELDAAARVLDRDLARSTSPQKRFFLLVQFFSNSRSLPESWLHSYALLYSTSFLELIGHPSVRNFSPLVWREALELLELLNRQGWLDDSRDYERIHAELLRKTVLSYAYVASLRELYDLLKQRDLLRTSIPERKWSVILGTGTDAFSLFRQFVGVLTENGESVAESLTAALKEWKEARERDDAVSVIFIEEDEIDYITAGRVLPMDIVENRDEEDAVHFHNPLDDQGTSTLQQIRRARSLADAAVVEYLRKRPPGSEFHVRIHQAAAEITGASLGLAAAAGFSVHMSKHLNAGIRWKLPTTVALVGNLDEKGSLVNPSWRITEKKLRIAFYSHVEQFVISSEHRELALHALQQLHREYPNRLLQIIGVSCFLDIFNIPGLVQAETRTSRDRFLEFSRRHTILMLLLLTGLLVGGASYFAYKAYYGYPNLEHALGLSVGAGSIVYNPKDGEAWCFRDFQTMKEAVVSFGDLVVGDGFSRTITVWNMTPRKLDVEYFIEGPSAADWFINWGGGKRSIRESSSERLSLMFVPTLAGKRKKAFLVLRNSDSGEEYFRLRITGSAGPPLPAGYALRLDGSSSDMYFGKQASVFEVKEGTFECWLKPLGDMKGIILHNGFSRSAENRITNILLGMETADSGYCQVGTEIERFVLPGEHRLEVDRWTHFALAYSVPEESISVYVNGVPLVRRKTEFLFPGLESSHVTIGAYDDLARHELFLNADLDEVRFWHAYRTREEISNDMHRVLPGFTKGLRGYWDMDNNVEGVAFSTGKRAHNARLRGRPLLVRSDAPLQYSKEDVRFLFRSDGKRAVELVPGRYLLCSQRILPEKGDATFAFTFRREDYPAVHFSYQNYDRGWITIENNALYTPATKKDSLEVPYGWHRALCRVSAAGYCELFIDGDSLVTAEIDHDGKKDWLERFEGVTLGYYYDRHTQPGPDSFDLFYSVLQLPRAYGNLRIWDRRLTNQEIIGLEQERVPQEGLVAEWILDGRPDENRNFSDKIHGHLLHVKQIRTWE